MRGPGRSEMVSIQKSGRSSSPPRRDGDADPARLLSRSCGLVSRTGSAAHHAQRDTQAHTHTSQANPRGPAPRTLPHVSRRRPQAPRQSGFRCIPRTFIGHGGRGEQGKENTHSDPHNKDTPQHHAGRGSIASPVLRVVAPHAAAHLSPWTSDVDGKF